MVNIIGLENHFFQIVGSKTKQPAEQLRSCIVNFLDDQDIDLIAEELTEDYCGIGCEEIVCKSIADSSDGDIEHRFVELNDGERVTKGILSEDHKGREAHWLSEIKDALDDDYEILFVCGMAHAESFKNLLEDEGYEAEITTILRTEPDWEPGI